MKHSAAVCLLSVLLAPTVQPARAETTSAVVAVSGSRRIVTLSGRGERYHGRAMYIGRETLEIAPRAQAIDVLIYVRGIPELDLFEGDVPRSPETCVATPKQSLTLITLTEPRRIGYRYCIPVDKFERAQGSLSVVSGNRDAEVIPLDFQPAKGLLESPAGTTAMSVLLVGLGAIVGLITSMIQQRIAIADQQRATFWQKMMEKDEELSEFFKEYQERIRNPTDAGDQADARRVRRLLSKQGAYAIMPPAAIRKLNRICDGRWLGLSGRRLRLLDRLIQRTFSEVMRQS